jgi:hypothetical protein
LLPPLSPELPPSVDPELLLVDPELLPPPSGWPPLDVEPVLPLDVDIPLDVEPLLDVDTPLDVELMPLDVAPLDVEPLPEPELLPPPSGLGTMLPLLLHAAATATPKPPIHNPQRRLSLCFIIVVLLLKPFRATRCAPLPYAPV